MTRSNDAVANYWLW